MVDFAELFEDLEDPRTGNAKRHALHEIVLIALCAVLSGGETCADMALFGRLKQDFLKKFLALEHGIPSHDTFSRLFRLLDPAAFRTWFLHAALRGDLRRGGGARWEDVAALLRSGIGGLAVASGECLGGRSAPGAGATRRRRQVERDRRRTEAVGTAVAERHDHHRRRAQLPAADRRPGDRAGRRLRAGAEGHQPALLDDIRRFLDDPETP